MINQVFLDRFLKRMHYLGYLLLLPSLVAHQASQFPGQDANNIPQGQHQQPAPSHQVPPPPPKFGGEEAKDEHHIKEHLDGKVDPTANMTPEQLQFHYFNMHDLDKNGKLDGVELIKAITHFHVENPSHQNQQPVLPSESELESMIDSILRDDDFNSDGYIDYAEFLKAQKMREDHARAQMQQQQQQQQQQHHQQQQQQQRH